MKSSLIALTLLLLLFNCKNEIEEQQHQNDELFVEDISGLQIDASDNLYNLDNKIYLPGLEFKFKYSYMDSVGQEYMFSREGYELTPKSLVTNRTITDISFSIRHDKWNFKEDYYQTVAQYAYFVPKDEGEALWPRTYSGIIENDVNVWMHPFRAHCYFRLLQLSPYPYIKRNLEIGDKWYWDLTTGNHYDCESWGTWEGGIKNEYEYYITEKGILLETELGELACDVVVGNGIGDLGPTKLVSYFNEKYGFVRLEYKNVNNSEMVIDLVGVMEEGEDTNK